MPAGLQIRNNANVLQIDGECQHYVLLRKGTQTGTGIPNGLNYGDPNNPQTTQMDIPMNPGELLAFTGPNPIAVAGSYQGRTQLHVFGPPASSPVYYFVFGPYTPSGLNYGLLIRDANGNPIWDTGRPPMRVLSTAAGVGRFQGAAQGRNAALICWQQYARMELVNMVPHPGSIGLYDGLQEVTSAFARVDGNDVVIQHQMYTGDPYGPYTLPNGTQGNAWDNGLNSKYTVVDVTGY
ncbi:hypothetical protein [Caballeronia sp. INDeC2]|uniref:hypothetical protein n=1 Tax=Caballeronia sp. INDeC2 TaxID=2921747 RepID=UPI002027A6DF|nr:hypothetical protein [Caballeronia sp. INDeC2]